MAKEPFAASQSASRSRSRGVSQAGKTAYATIASTPPSRVSATRACTVCPHASPAMLSRKTTYALTHAEVTMKPVRSNRYIARTHTTASPALR
ncbi:hypothetical protein SSPO_064130 [Streptomyces antimycoticus]|uniref:Uncharacterized protein n=1 Tax=Streptomyces antimycoticus TaxID=68175 RepID=A0A499UNQ8_9ACTN|nr:hypothetical protein SSPO_064130 [Streptomyces antimycoticus]